MSRFFKESAGTACHTFEAFKRGCLLLELEMTSFLPIMYNCFLPINLFRVTEFAHLLRIFSRFYPLFYNLLKRSNDIISHVLTSINREIFLDQSQFVSVVFLVFSIVLSCCLRILRNTAVFDFITCFSFCLELIIA